MRRSAVALLILVVAVLSTGFPLPLVAQQPSLRIASLVVQPATLAAGDSATVQVTVVDPSGAPVSGLQLQATVWPGRNALLESEAEAIVEVRSATEQEAGRYLIVVPLNEAGWWRIVVQATDGVSAAQAETEVFVTPRLSAPPASEDAVLVRGTSWITVLRFDPVTGSVVRFLGETVVRVGGRSYLVRRSVVPIETVSRLYGGRWQTTLVLTDVLTGVEQRFDVGPVRASLQGSSTTTPAMVFAVAGFSSQPYLVLYRAARLGESWRADLVVVDVQSGTPVVERPLPGAIRGTQVVPRLAITTGGQVVVLERALSLDGSGEARLSSFTGPALGLEGVRRWSFASVASGEVDCLANPERDGGVLGIEETRWYAWCRDGNGTWIGLWDVMTGALIARFGADPVTTLALPSATGDILYLVDLQNRLITAIDAVTGLPQQRGSSPASVTDRAWWRQLLDHLVPSARADSGNALRMSLSPDGRQLYIVFPVSGDFGDGVWVYDTATLEPIAHLLPGWLLRGVVVTPSGAIVAIAERVRGDQLIVLDSEQPTLLVTLPEHVSERLD